MASCGEQTTISTDSLRNSSYEISENKSIKGHGSGMAVIEEDISPPEAGGATETRPGTGPSDGISSDTHQHS